MGRITRTAQPLTVQQLIEQLQGFPPQMLVALSDGLQLPVYASSPVIRTVECEPDTDAQWAPQIDRDDCVYEKVVYLPAATLYCDFRADSLSASRAVGAAVLPPAPASTPESAQIEGLSPAKTLETSEGVQNQTGNGVGLIMELLLPVANSPQVEQHQSVSAHSSTEQVYVDACVPGAGVVGWRHGHV